MLLAFIFAVAVASGFLQSMSGFGYSVVSMTTLPLVMSPMSATTISGVVGNLQSLVLSISNRKYIRWAVTVVPLITSILFAWLSITVMAQRPASEYKRILGVFLIFIACYLLFFKATPQNTQKERPCGKIPPGRAYIRHSISAAATLI